MPKGSEKLTKARREEIISACEKLYETMNFKDITIKEIGSITSFTRTSIYNYFSTKEEIFLALLQREYELWIEQLQRLRRDRKTMKPLEFAEALAHSFESRKTLLKLMSMNHYDMEENSRIERLTEFKRAYGRSLDEVELCLKQYVPEMTKEARKEFLFSFFPFMFGIYPYTIVSDKQRTAMELAEVDYVYMTIFEITFAEIRKLLNI